MMNLVNFTGSSASSSASSTASSSASATSSALEKQSEKVKTSWVWEYFSSATKEKHPICSICATEINYGASKSTSKLKNHVFHQHRDIYDKYQAKEAAVKRKAAGSIQSFIVTGGTS